VTLDGHELRDLDRHWLRSQIGVVFQDPFLYSRSIGENVALGRPTANQQELFKACQDAAIRGQRQRLALARTLLKDPPVLVLDDSLSAVDTGTEQLILKALRERAGRQTTLIIAHRLSSVRHADRILVLNEGRLEQLGSHDELASQQGLYQRLCAIQGALDASINSDLNAATQGLTGEPQ